MYKVDISVIMPVYNGERYLSEALESVLKQTHKSFEIICIDDGSTDGTLAVLKRAQEMDGRVRILENKERAGAAFSRNRGIREAEGKYIAFLDGDDVFEEEMLAAAYKVMEEHGTDLVIYEAETVSNEHIYEKKMMWRNEQYRKKYCSVPFSFRKCSPDAMRNWGNSPCNKLFRKDFIIQNQLEFQTLPSCNDVYFVNMALFLSNKMIVLNDRRVMVYARNHNETTRISYDRDPMCAYYAIMKLGRELCERGVMPAVSGHYYWLAFFVIKNALMSARQEENARRFYAFLAQEGISRISELHRECYIKQDAYSYGLLENFKSLDFDSAWWLYETIFTYQLHRSEGKAISVFRAYENSGKRIALWGAGTNGRILLKFLQEHDLDVADVVDRDKTKQGKLLGKHIVRRPEDVIENVQVVVVCSFAVYRDVAVELEGIEIEIVNMDEVLQSD